MLMEKAADRGWPLEIVVTRPGVSHADAAATFKHFPLKPKPGLNGPPEPNLNPQGKNERDLVAAVGLEPTTYGL